jgi:hypothetical protein
MMEKMNKILILICILITIVSSSISAKTNTFTSYYSENNWIDVGQVVDQNFFVSNLISYEDDLYATHENKTYKYEGGKNWSFAGEIEFHHIRVLTIYDECLYAGTDYGSIHRYITEDLSWEFCGIAGFNCNHIHSFAVFNGILFAGTYTGNVYRYDGGTIWTYVGNPGESSIELWVEELIVYQDELYAAKIAGFQPEGARVYRYEGDTSWTYVGEPGKPENPHINDLVVYNGVLYAGNYDNTISIYEGDNSWKIIDELSDGAVNCFQICKNKLYFGTADHFHKQTHFYCYDGENAWVDLGMPITGTGSLICLTSFKNDIYGSGPVDFKGHVYCYDTGNDPPIEPTINGPISGKVGQNHTYTFTSNDLDGDDIAFYSILWDDDTQTNITGPFKSGDTIKASKIWTKKGSYKISAQATDILGNPSDWGELEITIPREKSVKFDQLKYITVHFTNIFTIMKKLILLL